MAIDEIGCFIWDSSSNKIEYLSYNKPETKERVSDIESKQDSQVQILDFGPSSLVSLKNFPDRIYLIVRTSTRSAIVKIDAVTLEPRLIFVSKQYIEFVKLCEPDPISLSKDQLWKSDDPSKKQVNVRFIRFLVFFLGKVKSQFFVFDENLNESGDIDYSKIQTVEKSFEADNDLTAMIEKAESHQT